MTGRSASAAVEAVDVVTLGETLALFRSTGVGPLAHNTAFTLSIGGAESNVAVAISRLGGTAAWCGRVGADTFGDLILRELRAEEVRVHAVQDPEARTAHMVREMRTPSLARVSYARTGSAGSRMTASDLPLATIRTAQLLHVTGITPALSRSAHEAVLTAVAEARVHGVTVSFDVNHRASLWGPGEARPVYRRLARDADIVFAGEEEAMLLLDDDGDAEQLARGIAALGPREVIIKRGAEGCTALIDDEMHRVGAVPIDPVDTVGAGDAFVGGYLADRASGRPPAERLITAAAAGAFACLNPGDWAGLPRRSELALLAAPDPVLR
ncbi:sugar kinase [Microbacterium sp. p3-SID338]|uniref:sugar kinase n=1 Tax=unclassified Microbacterium TaxID=2609290 RepID=UPI000C8051DE|nr:MULTISPECIES: sugar kinase [unclassified Microbacterium]MCT1397147.1 sugar kinase [Microbacterium sp. p3-SID338]PMC05129.1 sugar kinase [Microbacterium sp. UMB0228]